MADIIRLSKIEYLIPRLVLDPKMQISGWNGRVYISPGHPRIGNALIVKDR
jgi:hypothetical protein